VIGKIWGNCSFPSGHLAVSVAAILIISYLYNLKKGWFIFSSSLFILFLAFARIYVGMHYLSDVLGGIILGFISSLIIIYLERQIKWQ
jgi:undecaprenyl-diphosphatase